MDLPDYKYPAIELLEDHQSEELLLIPMNWNETKTRSSPPSSITISRSSQDQGNHRPPAVTLYEIVPAAGVHLQDQEPGDPNDIAPESGSSGHPSSLIPGKGTIGIEVPNVNKEVVSMRSQIASEKFQQAKMDLPICLGKDHLQRELYRRPDPDAPPAHGGCYRTGPNRWVSTASSSPCCIKKHPSQLKFVMVDPKRWNCHCSQLLKTFPCQAAW